VYLRQTEGQPHGEWDKLPAELLNDAAQLVKANSIEGNKKDNITVSLAVCLLCLGSRMDKLIYRLSTRLSLILR